MERLNLLIAVISALILFLFGIEGFSREVQKISGEKLRSFVSRFTRHPILGLLVGSSITAVIQSSTATSVIAVSLVNAGVLSFKNSLGIIFGANIGTTVTAQLVALKLTAVAPVFLILGFILSVAKIKYSFVGKSIFYFGFVFFSLNLVSSGIAPLRDNPDFMALMSSVKNPVSGILWGTLFTAVIQSSSVTSGLAVLLTQQGLLSLDQAIPIVFGANIGTTITAALASIGMDRAAKRTAMAHALFNVGGVLLFLPFLGLFPSWLSPLHLAPDKSLAVAHLIFNVVTAFVFLLLISPFSKLVEMFWRHSDEVELVHISLPVPSGDTAQDLRQTVTVLKETFSNVRDTYNIFSLSIESGQDYLHRMFMKRLSYLDYLKGEIANYLSTLAVKNDDYKAGHRIVELYNRVDYLFQVHDSLSDLAVINERMLAKRERFPFEVLLKIREICHEVLKAFLEVEKYLFAGSEIHGERSEIKRNIAKARNCISEAYPMLLKLISLKKEGSAGSLAQFLSYHNRILDKLNTLSHAVEAQRSDEVPDEPGRQAEETAASEPPAA
jgi:phosphate:Na+ symporter